MVRTGLHTSEEWGSIPRNPRPPTLVWSSRQLFDLFRPAAACLLCVFYLGLSYRTLFFVHPSFVLTHFLFDLWSVQLFLFFRSLFFPPFEIVRPKVASISKCKRGEPAGRFAGPLKSLGNTCEPLQDFFLSVNLWIQLLGYEYLMLSKDIFCFQIMIICIFFWSMSILGLVPSQGVHRLIKREKKFMPYKISLFFFWAWVT